MKKVLDYVYISNSILDMGLSCAELSVFVYLLSIYNEKADRDKLDWVLVRQSVIAEKCGIKSKQTVSKAIRSLMEKGLIREIRRTVLGEKRLGAYVYILNRPSLEGGYFSLERNEINGKTPRQMKVYLFICRSICNRIQYCWKSYTNIAEDVGMKRSEVMSIIKSLLQGGSVGRNRRKDKENRRLFVKNLYFLILRVEGSISKKPAKELRLRLTTKHSPKITLRNTVAKHILSYKNTTEYFICQALLRNFFAEGGGGGICSALYYPPIN